jgi:hypothetical protein
MIANNHLSVKAQIMRHRLIELCDKRGVGMGDVIPDDIWLAIGLSEAEIASIHSIAKRLWIGGPIPQLTPLVKELLARDGDMDWLGDGAHITSKPIDLGQPPSRELTQYVADQYGVTVEELEEICKKKEDDGDCAAR